MNAPTNAAGAALALAPISISDAAAFVARVHRHHRPPQGGLFAVEHQRRTVARYVALRPQVKAYLMPVLQGYQPDEYRRCIGFYGDALREGAWCGVGSICKRNGNVGSIEDVLLAIKRERPDLRLHGFGLKTTALASAAINDLLYSADSMAWSYAARREGRNAHDWREASRFAARINAQAQQTSWTFN